MTSVERVKEYVELPPEAPLQTHNDPPPGVWPSKGAIRFRNLHYSHHEDLPFVLKRINCKIYPGEKVNDYFSYGNLYYDFLHYNMI